MKKSLTFSFAMLLGVVVLLSPVSNALEADMSSSITYRPEDTQICYVSEIDEVISNPKRNRSRCRRWCGGWYRNGRRYLCTAGTYRADQR